MVKFLKVAAIWPLILSRSTFSSLAPQLPLEERPSWHFRFPGACKSPQQNAPTHWQNNMVQLNFSSFIISSQSRNCPSEVSVYVWFWEMLLEISMTVIANQVNHGTQTRWDSAQVLQLDCVAQGPCFVEKNAPVKQGLSIGTCHCLLLYLRRFALRQRSFSGSLSFSPIIMHNSIHDLILLAFNNASM